MAVSHEPPKARSDRRGWAEQIRVPEMWASLAIAVVWLAVLFDALFGPDFKSSGADGSNTTIPSAIIVALFAYLATRVIARYGFGRSRDED